jgi:hypothetical protein
VTDDWPGVTQVLRAVNLGPDLSMISPGILEAARRRGAAVHAAAEGIAYGYETEVPDEAAPYVSALLKFITDSRFEPIAAEVTVEHGTWRYRGHPDLIGWLNAHRVLVDLKTGESTGAAYQVAAYVDAWNAQHPGEAVTSGAVLHLREDGTYRFEEIELPAALPVWHAALIVYRAQARKERCG